MESEQQQEVVQSPEGATPEVVQVTREDLEQAIQDAAAAAADSAAGQVAVGVGESITSLTTGTVQLDDAQYQVFTDFASTSLHGLVVCCGLLALVLGAAIGIALTIHWRA